MCYNCFRRMRSVPPLYDRITRVIHAVNHDIRVAEYGTAEIAKILPGVIARDPDLGDVLTMQANYYLRQKDRLTKRMRRLTVWYFHAFPLFDLIAPTEDGASSQ